MPTPNVTLKRRSSGIWSLPARSRQRVGIRGKAEQARIQTVYRKAQERIARRQLTAAAGEDTDE